MNKEVKISITVDGVNKEIKSVNDLKEAVKELGDETKKTKKAAEDKDSALGLLKKRFNDTISGVKGVVKGMTTLKGALISSGIGAFVVLVGTLVSYFKNTEEGSRKLQIALEALNIIWGTLQDVLAKVGERLVNIFSDPKQALEDFGNLIKENIINRFNGILELIPNLGKAIKLLFKGEFEEAGKVATDALGKAILGVEDLTDKVVDFGNSAKNAFNGFIDEVGRAVEVATRLVDAKRALNKLNNDLIIQNAKLNKELNEQQRISRDTTRTLEERLNALDEIDKIQVKQAENIRAQAAAQEQILRLQIQEEGNYEARVALEGQLAQATAQRIDAETNLQNIQLKSGQLRAQLLKEEQDRIESLSDLLEKQGLVRIDNALKRSLEEIDIEERKLLKEAELLGANEEQLNFIRETFEKKRIDAIEENGEKINKILIENNGEIIDNAFERARKELDILEKKALDELDLLGATEEQKQAIIESFTKKRENLAEEEAKFNKDLAEAEKDFKLSIVSDAFSSIASLVGENSKLGKAAAVASAVIDTYRGANASLAIGGPFGFIAAAATVAAGLGNVRKILSTKIPGGNNGTISAPNIQAPEAPLFDPTEALRNDQQINRTIGLEQTGSVSTVRAYVMSGEITKQQEVDKKIENISRL